MAKVEISGWGILAGSKKKTACFYRRINAPVRLEDGTLLRYVSRCARNWLSSDPEKVDPLGGKFKACEMCLEVIQRAKMEAA